MCKLEHPFGTDSDAGTVDGVRVDIGAVILKPAGGDAIRHEMEQVRAITLIVLSLLL